MPTRLRARRVIGDALYGQVLECTMKLDDTSDPRLLAVKCVSLDAAVSAKRESDGNRTLDDPIREARVARLIKDSGGHPNIEQPLLQLHRSNQLCLVTELCDGGDLYTYTSLREPTRRLEPDEALGVMRQALAGVHFLHDRLRIAHRDLSLENVLISSRGGDELVFKISDFALSVPIDTECDDVAGKDIYMAPEIVARRRYDPAKADVWSLDIVWFILLTGSQLLSLASASNPTFKALRNFGVGAVFRSWGFDELATTPTVVLLGRMLCVDPAERISLASILADPVIKL